MRNIMREEIGLMDDPRTRDMLREAEDKRKREVSRIVESWSKYPKLSDNWKKLSDKEQEVTAVYLENQKNHMNLARKRLGEAQVSQDFILTPEKVLEVVRLSAPNSNLKNIFREIPMLSTDDAFYYVNAVYAENKTRAAAVQGLKYVETIDKYFASEKHFETVGTGDGSTVTFTKTLATIPVRPASIILVVDGAYVALDDGAGAFKSNALLSASSINYTNGQVSVTFTTAPAGAINVSMEYNWDSENSGNYDEFGELKLAIIKEKLEAKPSPLGFSYTSWADQVLATTGLGNAKDMLAQSVAEELAKARDFRAIALAKRVAKSNATITWDADPTSVGADSEYDHYQQIVSQTNRMGNAIYNELLRGKITKMVAGAGAVTLMSQSKVWTPDSSQVSSAVYLAGRLNGIEVYQCPNNSALVANDEIMGIYKNEINEGDCSIVFGTLIPMLDLGTLTYPQKFLTEGAIAHFGDEKVIQSKYIRLLKIDNCPF